MILSSPSIELDLDMSSEFGCSPTSEGNVNGTSHPRGGAYMPKSGGLTSTGFMVVAILALATNSSAQTRPLIVEQLAKTYGLDSFGQVEAVRYTFNLQRSGSNVSRSWVWEPKTGRISYEGKDKDGKPVRVTFVQSALNSESPVLKQRIDWLFCKRQLL